MSGRRVRVLALLVVLGLVPAAQAYPPRVVVGIGGPAYYPRPYYYPRPAFGFGVYVAPPRPVYVVPSPPPAVIVQPGQTIYQLPPGTPLPPGAQVVTPPPAATPTPAPGQPGM